MTIQPVILLVEDHGYLRSSLKCWLASVFPDFNVLEVNSAESAVLLLNNFTPRMVVMDITLPGMDGIVATRLIKARLPDTDVVMLSIHDEQAYRKSAELAGAAGYVSKASLHTELIPVLKELLERTIK